MLAKIRALAVFVAIFLLPAMLIIPANSLAQQSPSNEEQIFKNNCTIVILKGLKNFMKVTTYAALNQKCYELTTLYKDRVHFTEICPTYVSAYAFKDGVVFNVELSMVSSGDYSLSIISTAEKAGSPLVYIISLSTNAYQPIRIFPNTSNASAEVAFFMLPFCAIK